MKRVWLELSSLRIAFQANISMINWKYVKQRNKNQKTFLQPTKYTFSYERKKHPLCNQSTVFLHNLFVIAFALVLCVCGPPTPLINLKHVFISIWGYGLLLGKCSSNVFPTTIPKQKIGVCVSEPIDLQPLICHRHLEEVRKLVNIQTNIFTSSEKRILRTQTWTIFAK